MHAVGLAEEAQGIAGLVVIADGLAAGAADDSDPEPDDPRPSAPETVPVFATITAVPNAAELRGEQVPEYIQPGRVLFGRYEVLRELGRGGMGVVYLVRHLAPDVERALKTISRDWFVATQRRRPTSRKTMTFRPENRARAARSL